MEREVGRFIGIVFLVAVLVFVSGTIVYLSLAHPERRLDVGADIESVDIEENLAYITLSGGSNDKEIKLIKFVFTDNYDVERYYPTTEGIAELSVEYNKSILNLLKKPEFSGTYDYVIDSNNIGLADFGKIYKIEVIFEYEKEVLEIQREIPLDTIIINENLAPSSGGLPGGGFIPKSDLIPVSKAYWKYENTETTQLNNFVYGNLLNLILENSGLPSGTNMEFTIYERDPFEDDYLAKLNVNMGSNGYAFVEWMINETHVENAQSWLEGNRLELYFEVNGIKSDILKIDFYEEEEEPEPEPEPEPELNFTGTIYYVSTNGDDNNYGLTEATAWQTLQYAADNVTEPGSVIALKKGDIWLIDNVLEINQGGNSTHDIIWDGGIWGVGDKAIIRSNSDGGNSPKYNSIVGIADVRYLTFQNIHIDGANTKRYGLMIGGPTWDSGPTAQNNEHHITIQDSDFTNIGDGEDYRIALLVRPWLTDISNIIIQRNNIDGVSSHGIAFYAYRSDMPGCSPPCGTPGVASKDSYIGYNTVTNFREFTGNVGHGLDIVNAASNITIEYNTVTTGETGTGKGISVSSNEPLNGYYPTDIIIRYNTVILDRNQVMRFAGGQAITAEVYGNLLWTDAPGQYSGNVRIEQSLSRPYEGADLKFYDNTMIIENSANTNVNSRNFIDQTGVAGATTLKNNILFNDNGYILWLDNPSSCDHSNNLYLENYNELNWVYDGSAIYSESQVLAFEPTAVITNPLFIDADNNDFRLKETSPAIDNGTIIPGFHCETAGEHLGEDCVEWYGNAPDIGAFESEYVASIGTNYYVSTSGDDNNNGNTTAAPWQTINKVNTETFEPGDSILFKRGDTWRETLNIPSSGTAENYITFGSYGIGNKPRILGSEQASDWTEVSTNVWQSNTVLEDIYSANPRAEVFFEHSFGDASWGVHRDNVASLTTEYEWTWENNNIYVYASSDPSSIYNSVEVPQRNNIIYSDNAEYFAIDGLALFYSKSGGVIHRYRGYYESNIEQRLLDLHGYILRNSEIAYLARKDDYGYGSYVVHSDSLVENNIIHDVGRRSIVFYNYGLADVSNITIQNNTLYNGFHTTGIDLAVGSEGYPTGDMSNIVIRNNLIYEDEYKDPFQIDYGDQNVFSQMIFANAFPDRANITDLYIYNNVFKHPTYASIMINSVIGSYVFNNVFYGQNRFRTSNNMHIFYSEGTKDIHIKNNIFYGDANMSISSGGVLFYFSCGVGCEGMGFDETDVNNNLYYHEDYRLRLMKISDGPVWNPDLVFCMELNPNCLYGNLTDLQERGWEIDSPDPADPLFVDPDNNDFRLQEGSPAIDAGAIIPGIHCDTAGSHPNEDCVEWNEPAPDIGAFEFY